MLDLRLPSHQRLMHKLAYAEDGGGQLIFRKWYYDIPSYAVETKNSKLGEPDQSRQ